MPMSDGFQILPAHSAVLNLDCQSGIVLGACVPVILTSRADSAETRLTSCAVACLLHYADHPIEER